MSDMKASVVETEQGFHVEGYEKIEYDFSFIDGVFDLSNSSLANCYKRWGRCLAVMDSTIFDLYGYIVQEYFDHHGLTLQLHKTMIGEKAKSIDTMLSIVDSMNDFGIFRKEPVLCIGGGLVTDVCGFACAAYRRNTNYIRIPTTVIGLIDAAVSIKVAVNYGNYKNRLGAYHAPMHTFLDFTFLRTLPEAQVRNGFAELIKISSCAHRRTFDLLDKHCEELISSKFGRADGSPEEVRVAANEIVRAGIYEMLKLETPNLHEIGLDRVIAYGHTWSPLHELIPETPLRHGHAISIDMAYSATLANISGLLDDTDHTRLLNLFSRAGLAMDHDQFDENVLDKGTKAILRTRDGKLRAAVPSPLGECIFLNDVSIEELNAALRKHKQIVTRYATKDGIDAFVDSSDTGEGVQALPKTVNGHKDSGYKATQLNDSVSLANGHAKGYVNGHANGSVNGHANGSVNGHANGSVNGHANGIKSSS